MKKNKLIIIFSFILIFIVCFISIGYSSFEKVFNINNITAHVQATKDIRITDFVVESVNSNALAEAEVYDYNSANVDLMLPKADSYITYKVTVTNFGNVNAMINSIKIIGENSSRLQVSVEGYELGSILEDNNGDCVNSQNGCTLGVSRSFNIIVKNIPGVLYPSYHYKNVYIEFQFGSENAIELGENIFKGTIPNTYIERNGVETSYSNWSSSDFIDVSKYKELIITSSSSMLGTWNACYDENKNFISTFTPQSARLYNEKLGTINTSIAFVKLNQTCKYIRISDSSGVINGLKIYPTFTENYNHHFLFLYNPTSYDEFIYGENHMNYDDIVPNSYISSSNGSVISYGGWYSTGFIDIRDLDEYIVASPVKFSPNAYSGYYDENYNFISTANLPTVKQDYDKNYYSIAKKPANAVYVRFSESSASRSYYSMIVSSYELKQFNTDPSARENFVIAENIFDTTSIVENQYIEQNGVITSYSNWSYTDEYYPIGKGLIIPMSIGSYNAIYDENYNFKRNYACGAMIMKNEYLGELSVNLCYIRPSSSDKFIRFSNVTGTLKNYKVYPVLNDDFNYVFEFELK